MRNRVRCACRARLRLRLLRQLVVDLDTIADYWDGHEEPSLAEALRTARSKALSMSIQLAVAIERSRHDRD